MDHHEKLAWSAQHLHALDLEIKDFVERHPFTATGHHRHGTREFDVIVDERPFLPSHWPLMAGDVIHNMRAALDYLIWALIDKSPTKPNKEEGNKVGYPISLREGAYWGEGDQRPKNGARGRQARWIGDDALAIVDRTQPYHNGDRAHAHPLGALAVFSNEDKHRKLAAHAALATSVQFSVRHTAPTPFRFGSLEFHSSGELWLDSGANLGVVEFSHDTTCEGMEVEPLFEGRVVFMAEGVPDITVTALEELLYILHRDVVAPLDAILCRP